MSPESENYFADLAERIGRIEANVEQVPQMAKDIERVRVLVEGVDGDNGLKKSVDGMKKDVADIKQYRSNEDAVAASKKTFWTPVKTIITSVLSSVTAAAIIYALLRS